MGSPLQVVPTAEQTPSGDRVRVGYIEHWNEHLREPGSVSHKPPDGVESSVTATTCRRQNAVSA
jgi:hypothetical protein